MIQAQVRRVAPDWGLRRGFYQLSYGAAARGRKRGLPEVREPDALVREGRVVREVPVEHVELVHLHQVLAESAIGFNNDQQF